MVHCSLAHHVNLNIFYNAFLIYLSKQINNVRSFSVLDQETTDTRS